jgi:hypothetical protein
MKIMMLILIALSFQFYPCLAVNTSPILSQDAVVQPADTTQPAPDFKQVNVIVETEWGDPETTKDADVFIHYEKNQPKRVMLETAKSRCEINLFPGMTVKIVDPKSGKVLKTIHIPEEKPKKK